MSASVDLPSRTRINRCGQALVAYWHSNLLSEAPDIPEHEAVEVLNAFRRAHEGPLLKVRLGLASFARSEGTPSVVSQRLKRRARIIRKLSRFDNSMLARLEDIGGCRIVFANPADLYQVLEHMHDRWESSIKRDRNYIQGPNPMGYRAHHVVVERDGRRIEIQLRTRGQQQWADAVEAADSRLGLTLKDGVGPASMLEYFSATGDVIYAREFGLGVTSAMMRRFEVAQDAVIEDGYYRR